MGKDGPAGQNGPPAFWPKPLVLYVCWSNSHLCPCLRPSRAGRMVGPTGTVSELFAKMLFFHKTILFLCEKSDDLKIKYLMNNVLHLFVLGCTK